MSERPRPPATWPLVVAIVIAVATEVLLVGALVVSRDSTVGRAIVLGAAIAILVLVIAGAVWAAAMRRAAPDPLLERAETASKIAHELKNPLASIKGLASTGVKLFESMSDAERLEFFQLIDDEASRLKLTIEQSATALRIEAGSVSYDLQPTDVGALVEELAWRSPHGEHPMVVETEPGLEVPLDRLRFTEVVENLLDNAAKFSPPDAPIEVRVARDDDDWVIIEIADRGPGITPEHRSSVFERFSSWRPPGYEETPGSGLGLFIARAHVLAHGGRMALEDRDEGGTMLRVTVPGGG
ncbi:MAG: HAMP domain-containing sensor histidine kinase [Actinomycetota bacterium]